MQCFLAARIAEVEYDDAVFVPAHEAWEAGGDPVSGEIIVQTEKLTDARCDAEEALILTPTNDAANVRWKLAYCRVRCEDFCDFPDDWWDAINADLDRIAAGGVA